ncbi:Glutamyl-tRNA(Gln) amidotransferase subunit A [Achromobacter spanius]|uniref:amidase n=1 Tax=Achromobacter spanius TaxID=217203 RepID=UPI000C2BF5CE|nr:amidase [Achromobacter spanius]AUA55862.1 amidase [Achromobacter spanius]CAB3639367.1 Glutamyl-tRNA(Gln) amidotransferase subunit A, chloroplastic/mitochondrial [Achromobacter spanius]SPT36670.1 Glutamyl-tRNA(Gln) amidotransferase subunit A [Achromobacter denitrificans]VEE56618.1 Glutamyl-tRNA(Gln) amidotransferase subunit A [Achromobacter spanius]
MPAQHPTDLHFRDARELARAIRDRELSSRQVTAHFLDRIERAAPLAAFSEVTAERALAQADAADRLQDAGMLLGPLHGVPVAVKDSIQWQGTPTTGGSQARRGVISTETSAAVRALAAAGMVILGKTRMTEFAFGLSGQNPTQGTARNPWDAKVARAPGGSSSGAGVAVAAGLTPIALGGDTGGSVRAPAALNGVVGYKPSSGLISRAGCLPLSDTLDVLGPIARSVADARLLAQVLAGPDVDDAATLALHASCVTALRHPVARRVAANALAFSATATAPTSAGAVTPPTASSSASSSSAFLASSAASGDVALPAAASSSALNVPISVTILPPQAWPAPLSDAALQVWHQAQERLAQAGLRPTAWHPPASLSFARMADDNSLVLAYEAYRYFGALAENPAAPLWEVVRARIAAGGRIAQADYEAALNRRQADMAAFAGAMQGLDALLMPACDQGAQPLDAEDVRHVGLGKLLRPANFLGAAAITLPAGFDAEGMPIGVQLLAPAGRDAPLLDCAATLERVLAPTRQTPDMSPWDL